MYANTHDSYFEYKTTVPSPCGDCCGVSTFKSVSPYTALDHLVLKRDCTCLAGVLPQCCFRYGLCPFYPTINMGWRDGKAFMMGGVGTAYNFWVGTGPEPALEIHDLVQGRIRCAKSQGALALVDDAPTEENANQPQDFFWNRPD